MAFIRFWKKDIINKLIVITSLLLVGGVFIIVEMIINMPPGKSLSGVFSEFLPIPTPTLELSTLPTFTAVPTGELVYLPSLTPVSTKPDITATEIAIDSRTIAATVTNETEEVSTATPTSNFSSSCIPNKSPQNGRVVEVLDGTTIRVLMNGLVYVVHYIGVENPAGKFQTDTARIMNSNLVYGNDVKLIADASDKDASGRLLRYVLVGDTFVNLELVQKGWVSISKSDGAASCDQSLESAELSASSAGLGIWAIASPTPKP